MLGCAASKGRQRRERRERRQTRCLQRPVTLALRSQLAQEPGINGERQFGCWRGGSQLVLPSSESTRAAQADESRRRRGPPTRAAAGTGGRGGGEPPLLFLHQWEAAPPQSPCLVTAPLRRTPTPPGPKSIWPEPLQERSQNKAAPRHPAPLPFPISERSGGFSSLPGAPTEAGGHRPHRPHRPHHHLPAGHRSPRPRPGQGAGTRRRARHEWGVGSRGPPLPRHPHPSTAPRGGRRGAPWVPG